MQYFSKYYMEHTCTVVPSHLWFHFPWSMVVQKYEMDNFRTKQSISLKMCAVAVMKSPALLLPLAWEVNHPLVPGLPASHTPRPVVT